MKNRITRAVSNYNLGFRFLINKLKEKIYIYSYVRRMDLHVSNTKYNHKS